MTSPVPSTRWQAVPLAIAASVVGDSSIHGSPVARRFLDSFKLLRAGALTGVLPDEFDSDPGLPESFCTWHGPLACARSPKANAGMMRHAGQKRDLPTATSSASTQAMGSPASPAMMPARA